MTVGVASSALRDGDFIKFPFPQKEEKRMSASIRMPKVPTFESLMTIVLENTALARTLGLPEDESADTSARTVQRVTAVMAGAINVDAFFGPINFPDSYPSNWQ